MSLGTPYVGSTTQFLSIVLATWKTVGIKFVCAAGNGDLAPASTCLKRVYPATDRRTFLTVCAVDKGNLLAGFSFRSSPNISELLAPKGETSPKILAPGVGIDSTWPDGSYMALSGTSMATPHVAGAVALFHQANPDLTLEELREAIFNGADEDVRLPLLVKDCDPRQPPNNIIGNVKMDLLKTIQMFGIYTCSR